MVDFRYHLISLIAVFLALGLGILMGSVVLEEAFVEDLQSDVEELRDDKAKLQEDVLALDRQLDADVRFAEVAQRWLIHGALSGREVVLLRLAGTDDRVVDGFTDSITEAGGKVAATILLTEKLALPGQVERDQLALLTGSASGREAELREEGGRLLGRAVAAAYGETRRGAAGGEQFIRQMEGAGFLEVETEDEQGGPSSRADFVFVGGSDGPRPFNLPGLAIELCDAIVEEEGLLLVAESSDSTWELVSSIRDSGVEDRLTTVDDAETIAGRVATVLALAEMDEGNRAHYGTGPGATEVIPEPNTED